MKSWKWQAEDAPALPPSAIGYCPASRLLKSQTLNFSSPPTSPRAGRKTVVDQGINQQLGA